jgi:quinol-cytochrome oxidoreductase complex cytochrome b subunit
MALDSIKYFLVVGGLIGFVVMLISMSWADRKMKRQIAEGKEPSFSWAWFIFSVVLLAQGVYRFIKEWILEEHMDSSALARNIWQWTAILLLAIGISFFINQVRWLIYSKRKREE